MNLFRSLVSIRPRHRFREYRRRWRDRLRGETVETYFDIHNPDELDPVLLASGADPLRVDSNIVDAASAIRFVLGLLTNEPWLRRKFRFALSAGPEGAFARWVVNVGRSRYGLSSSAVDQIKWVFLSFPGEKGKRVFEVRRDLRSVFPFGLTPLGRGEFLGWLLRHGTRDLGFTPEEALWFTFEMDEVPDRGLAATYLVRPDWQEKFPDALTPSGWPAFQSFLRTEFGLRGRWFDRARPTVSPAASGPGVNVLGHFRYPSGLQEAAAGLVAALSHVGVATSCRDIPVLFPSDWSDRNRYRGVECFDTTITVAAANTFPDQFYPDAGLHRRPGVYRIANWYWELEEVPVEWVTKLGWADEVWAPTRFVAEAFRKVVRVPVVEMLPGVELPRFEALPKSYFGMNENRFAFLFTFDMHSTAARKNPLGVVEAFRRAFRPGDGVELFIKVSRGTSFPDDLAALRTAAESVGATVIDRVMPRSEVLGLMNAADCFVSLHRSEGLGLGMIESMLLGKPVIGTAYSGNLDFMTASNSFLVRAGRTPVTAQTYAYPKGCVWGDPDLDHAAELMLRVHENRVESRTVGARARREMGELLSFESYGRRMASRLRAIGRAGII